MKNQWDNITLDEFTQIRAVLEDEGRSSEDKMIALAAIVQGVSEDTILEMPIDQVRPVFEMVQGLDATPKRSKARKHYQVGEWALLITPSEKMSVAQWIDFQNYAKEGMEKHMADLLSVALVPVGKKYNEGYDIQALKTALGGMGVSDALAVCFFFQKRWLRSMRRILTYLAGWSLLKGQKELRREALKVRREVSATLRSL